MYEDYYSWDQTLTELSIGKEQLVLLLEQEALDFIKVGGQVLIKKLDVEMLKTSGDPNFCYDAKQEYCSWEEVLIELSIEGEQLESLLEQGALDFVENEGQIFFRRRDVYRLKVSGDLDFYRYDIYTGEKSGNRIKSAIKNLKKEEVILKGVIKGIKYLLTGNGGE